MACKIMGIVNVTPDSFSDGGKYFTPAEAVRRAKNLVSEGAAFIDVGGESTRPGSSPLEWKEEWARIEPVVSEIASLGLKCLDGSDVILSVDTYHPETAAKALEAGAGMINCVYAAPVPEMFSLACGAKKEVSLSVPYECRSLQCFSEEGAPFVYFDPMIGFGPSREDDIRLLGSIREMAAEVPVLVGASRKRVIKRLTGVKTPGKDIAGNLAVVVWAALLGASVVRVHDVRESVQALRVIEILRDDDKKKEEEK